MTTVRFIACIASALLAMLFILFNWSCVIGNPRGRHKENDKHKSFAPLLSVILAAISYWLCPYNWAHWLWILPAIDIGNWAVVVGLPWAVATGMFRSDENGKNDRSAGGGE